MSLRNLHFQFFWLPLYLVTLFQLADSGASEESYDSLSSLNDIMETLPAATHCWFAVQFRILWSFWISAILWDSSHSEFLVAVSVFLRHPKSDGILFPHKGMFIESGWFWYIFIFILILDRHLTLTVAGIAMHFPALPASGFSASTGVLRGDTFLQFLIFFQRTLDFTFLLFHNFLKNEFLVQGP